MHPIGYRCHVGLRLSAPSCAPSDDPVGTASLSSKYVRARGSRLRAFRSNTVDVAVRDSEMDDHAPQFSTCALFPCDTQIGTQHLHSAITSNDDAILWLAVRGGRAFVCCGGLGRQCMRAVLQRATIQQHTTDNATQQTTQHNAGQCNTAQTP